MTLLRGRWMIAGVLAVLAGCASTPPPERQAVQDLGSRAACQAGTNARGIAAGFFAFFQDRPECF